MRFLRRKDENFLYGWTQTLADRPEFIECDKNGTPTETPILPITTPEPAPIKPEKVADKPISSMDDIELEAYARKNFNVELDRRCSVTKLRKQVKGLMSGELSAEDVANGLTEPVPEEPEPVVPLEIPEMPEKFATKQDAIRWAKDKELGISFRARDTKAKTIERIEKALADLRGE